MGSVRVRVAVSVSFCIRTRVTAKHLLSNETLGLFQFVLEFSVLLLQLLNLFFSIRCPAPYDLGMRLLTGA